MVVDCTILFITTWAAFRATATAFAFLILFESDFPLRGRVLESEPLLDKLLNFALEPIELLGFVVI